ncbi:nitrite reductase [Propioniciclava coleopterorum]|uniref:Nitrite reductase n=1 Tax=Propioniciclava coleopterorum TaxID=2714937 RepID=A0A6G7Y6Y5_9ACTN|nr:nitrite reductase [Propioniciclava coleopterorum]QIK72391.1 nitrite reductase [Propioniciclava coleopterorum]
MSVLIRDRADRCPGILRPWPAADGLLVRVRLVGGRITARQLRGLSVAATVFGDGCVRPTTRANLQLRAFPGTDGVLDADALAAIEASGLLPAPAHDRVRNITVSPQTGLAGGRADLRPLAADLDAQIVASDVLPGLPGKFAFVLDDGRGDLIDRPCDVGLVALDAETVQLRVGEHYGAVVPLAAAARELIALAELFCAARGTGPTAPWHTYEMASPLVAPVDPDPRVPQATGPLPFGPVPGGLHAPVGDDGLDPADVDALLAGVDEVVFTPWKGVLIPSPTQVASSTHGGAAQADAGGSDAGQR